MAQLRFLRFTPFMVALFLLCSVVWGQEDTSTNLPESKTDAEVSLEFLDEGTVPTSLAQLRAMEKKVAEVFERVKPATVNIQVGMGQGTGVVISRDGYILTAAHVINGPDRQATVTFPDGKRYVAETLGVNPVLDSGMLKLVDKKKKRWPYIDLGMSSELKEGQWVVAIGHPGGIDMKRGLVLRVGRIVTQTSRVLRTDCTLVGGDSGGPLVNMNGDLIGIHSRIGNSLNDNMHVPADVYSDEWDRLADGEVIGRQARPYIGLSVVDNTNRIESISRGGPADKAKLRPGDVIIKIDGEKIENKADLGKAFRGMKPRQEITVVVERTKLTASESEDGKPKRSKEELTLKLVVGRN